VQDPAAPSRRASGARRERRAELGLGAVSLCVLLFIGLLMVTVTIEAWPSFSHNGFYKWFGPGGDPEQQLRLIYSDNVYRLRAWPIIWDTILTTGGAVVIALSFSIFAAVFIAELAPPVVRRVMHPVVRLLAAVPSVIYGLIGILAIAPWVEHNFISQQRKRAVQEVVQLTGANLSVATLILTVMICPILISLISSALATVPRTWVEGSEALGANRWRTIWKVSLRAARPAIVAATVLATGRALGEAIMLSMVGGSRAFAPNVLDGATFFFEPVKPFAAAIIDNFEGLSAPTLSHTLYAFAWVLLVSCALLSLAGWAVKQQMKRYGIGT
jgi:phosphate transport system permease protein